MIKEITIISSCVFLLFLAVPQAFALEYLNTTITNIDDEDATIFSFNFDDDITINCGAKKSDLPSGYFVRMRIDLADGTNFLNIDANKSTFAFQSANFAHPTTTDESLITINCKVLTSTTKKIEQQITEFNLPDMDRDGLHDERDSCPEAATNLDKDDDGISYRCDTDDFPAFTLQDDAVSTYDRDAQRAIIEYDYTTNDECGVKVDSEDFTITDADPVIEGLSNTETIIPCQGTMEIDLPYIPTFPYVQRDIVSFYNVTDGIFYLEQEDLLDEVRLNIDSDFNIHKDKVSNLFAWDAIGTDLWIFEERIYDVSIINNAVSFILHDTGSTGSELVKNLIDGRGGDPGLVVIYKLDKQPVSYVTTACEADDVIIVTAQLNGEGSCFFDDGVDLYVWSYIDTTFGVIEKPPIEILLEDTIGINDTISVKPSTIYLNETISITDTITDDSPKKCIDFDILVPSPVIDPTCERWADASSRSYDMYVSVNNGPAVLLVTDVCTEDNFFTVAAQLGANEDCFIDDGTDAIVWTRNFDALYAIEYLDSITSPDPSTPLAGVGPTPDPAPEPVAEPIKVKQTSTPKSGGGGRTNVDVSSFYPSTTNNPSIDKSAPTSLDRIAEWVSSERYFKIGINDLISQNYVDLKPSQIKNPPEWFYIVSKLWASEKITNDEFFSAVEYILT